MNRGKLVVTGGNDGAGKRTQSEILANRLRAKLGNDMVVWRSFPLYGESFWGPMIGRYLKKPECGEPLPEHIACDPKQASLLYELERRELRGQMELELSAGRWIICDRYSESNLAHQAAKYTDSSERSAFVEWLLEIQRLLDLPVPDMTIILSLSQDIRDRRVENRRASDRDKEGQVSQFDRHEQDRPYMEQVNGFYPELAERFNWPIVNCSPNGEQLSVEAIAEEVWGLVTQTFSLN